jgi:Protein of unknown function (DUF2786)
LAQKDELARVKARIKALAEKAIANGCTEAEAMSAAAMPGRLLERYTLSMDEIEVRSARFATTTNHDAAGPDCSGPGCGLLRA